MQQHILMLKTYLDTKDRPISSPSVVKFGPRNPENRLSEMPHPLKLDGGSVLYRQ